jgi:Ni2+-binding GTPase involved in maturation of urease and hydrogenase
MDGRPEEDDEYEVWWKVYIGAINWEMAENDIQKIINKFCEEDELKDLIKKKNVIVPALDFIMNNDKKVMENSITLSTAAWVLGKITSDGLGKNNITELVEFEADSFNIKQAILSTCFSDDNFEKIFDLQSVVADLLGIDKKYFVKACNICVRKIVKKTKNFNKKNTGEESTGKEKALEGDRKYPELDIFNSFFLDEIQNVKKNVNVFKGGSAISKYLGESNKPDFIDILKDKDALNKLIYSDQVCHVRWPHHPKKSPALLQAIAANSMLKNDREARLFAINGPPGTGKTTMMFNIIANLYVERAEQLAKLDSPEKAFDSKKKKTYAACNGWSCHISELISDLQGYEIVVVSSNNAAVENISNEITFLSNADENFNREVDYFKWLNNEKGEEKHWGLFAVVLGNRSNCSKFINKIWEKEDVPVHNYVDKKQEQIDDEEINKKPLKPLVYKHKTMFQYLNVIKDFGTSEFSQYCSNELKKHIPKYIFSDKEYSKDERKEISAKNLKNKWRLTCDRFNEKLKLIKNIHQVSLKLKELKNKQFYLVQSLSSVKIGKLENQKQELESQKRELEGDNVDCDLIIRKNPMNIKVQNYHLSR